MRNKTTRNKPEQTIIKKVNVPRNKTTEQIKVNVTIDYQKIDGKIIQIDNGWIEERIRKNKNRWLSNRVTEKTYLKNCEKFKELKNRLDLQELIFNNSH